MNYLMRELGKNEKMVNLSGISWWLLSPYIFSAFFVTLVSIIIAMAGNLVYATFFFGIGVLLSIVFSFPQLIGKLTTEIAITDQRVISKKGWLQVTVTSTPLSKVNNINVYQGVLGNIFNYGNVEITTATSEESDNHIIRALHSPKNFRNILSEEIDRQEQERGFSRG